MQPLAEVRPLGPSDPLAEPALHRELFDRYLVWDAFVAGARRVDVHPLVLPAALHASAVCAAEAVTRIVCDVGARAHEDAEERARYRFPACVEALAAASHTSRDDALLARVDLLLGDDGRWRACELNADCPGGHNEALGLPNLALAAGFRGGANPTVVTGSLVDRLIELAGGRAVGLMYATAYAEDLQICALLRRLIEARGARALLVSPTQPRLRGEALVARGEALGVLYRFFPAEYMEGQKNLPDILAAVASGAVRTLTSFGHIYAQSKLAFARTWAIADSLPAADRALLSAHLPESHEAGAVPRTRLVEHRADWVLKRALGRVGDQVYVGALFHDDEWSSVVAEIQGLCGEGESWIAQRFVRQRTIPTPWGDRYVTLGAYVQDGRFVGYFARITPESHVSHDALCVPVFVAPAEAA
ncbi:MAG TPA: glutathionylspermidine synthase family protein [Polyangiaceae bacterium]|jgi:glutathionylspermidine synthase